MGHFSNNSYFSLQFLYLVLTMNKQDNISGINDENFLDNENEKNLQEINLESSSKI